MSPASEPPAPPLPGAPDAPDPPRPPERAKSLLSPTFWVGLVFGLVCILLGVAIAVYGARLFPVKPAPAATAPAATKAAALPPPPGTRTAGSTLFEPAPAALPEAAAVSQPEGGGDVSAFNSRLDRIEAQHRATVNAAAAALAVSALADAAETSRPFVREVDALIRVAPASPDLQALRDLAAVGAPARSLLGAEFDTAAARAATASRAPGEVNGPLARITGAFAALVTIRRTSRLTGTSPDAVLARAERRVNEGDLQAALTELAALPPSGREAMATWSASAERRLAIERRIGAIRSRALADLAKAQGAG